MLISQLLTGVVLLVFGRRLFWLFVAACGFLAGLSLAPQLTTTQAEWKTLLIALLLGILGALLGLLFERVAIGVAGFLAGAYIASRLLAVLGFQGPLAFWVAFVVGGLIGAVLLNMVFDWSLIGLSSLAGSFLILDAAHLSPSGNRGFLLWLGLLVFGILVQAAQMRGKGRRGAAPRPRRAIPCPSTKGPTPPWSTRWPTMTAIPAWAFDSSPLTFQHTRIIIRP